MRRQWCAAIFGILAGGLVAAAPPLRAQATATPPSTAETPPDSTSAPDSTRVLGYRFSPSYVNRITADVSSVGMANEFHTGLLTPWGSIFDFALSGDEKNYRLQNRLEQSKLMKATDYHTFGPTWSGLASYTDSRVFNRSIAVGGGVQDFIINDRTGSLSSNYLKKFDKLRSDVAGSASATNGERTFKTDRSLEAGVHGGVAYSFGDRVVWQGRGALSGSSDRSQSADALYTGLGSSEDSLVTAIGVQLADSIRFDASHKQYKSDRDFTDQARGSLGGQTSGAENIIVENEKRDTRNTNLSMNSRIFSRLSLQVSALHDEQEATYKEQPTRNSRTVLDGVNGTVSYTLPWKTVSSVTFDNSSTLRDLGPQSISSLTDKRKSVALLLSHQFTKTFSMSFNGTSQLQQSFYLKYAENPRDRDQVDTSFNLGINSQPFKDVTATISLGYSNSEFVNIDSTQSENNRTRELWEMRPAFTYVVNPMLIIIQNYGIAIEYTDYAFKETSNFLDRTLTFSNQFQFRPMRTTKLIFEYGLNVHDTGSYLPDPVTGERLLDVASKDRRDRTRIRVDYTATKEIGFFAENLYSRLEDRTTGSDQADVTTDGQIAVGTSVNYDWGKERKLTLLVSHVRRFSPFGADAEKNYWDARSQFTYPF